MISKLKYTLFAVFCSLLLMAVAASAQPKNQDKSDKSTKTDKSAGKTKPDNSVADKKSEIEFPDVDGWERSKAEKYPSAELGYSLAYQSEDGVAVTIYVYNGGLKKISSDITDNTLKSEMEFAKGGIKQFGEAGIYQNVKEVKSDTVTLGGTSGKVKALHSIFTFRAKGREAISEIYLFGHQNNFIKIRATRPKSQIESQTLTDLLSKLDAAFSK